MALTRKRRIVIAAVAIMMLLAGGFWLSLPDQRFVGRWSQQSKGSTNHVEFQYLWNGSATKYDRVTGEVVKFRWHASKDRFYLLTDPGRPGGILQHIKDAYARLVQGDPNGYDVVFVDEHTIQMRQYNPNHQRGLVTLKRISK